MFYTGIFYGKSVAELGAGSVIEERIGSGGRCG